MASILEVSSSLRLPALAARVGTQTGKVNTVSVQNAVPAYTKLSMVVKAAGDDEVTSRRAICLVATTIAAGVLAGNASALSNIQLAGPGKPSGGLRKSLAVHSPSPRCLQCCDWFQRASHVRNADATEAQTEAEIRRL